jgi:hypothetical protein
MVGRTYGGCTASAPPSAARPPSASPSAMCRRMVSSWAGMVIGPIVDSSSTPTFSFPTPTPSRSMNWPATADAT